jgi:WD40 repeat protein
MIYILSEHPERQFEIMYMIKADGYVKNTSFNSYEGSIHLMALLSNSLVETYKIPKEFNGNKLEPLSHEILDVRVRKIDNRQTMVMSNEFSTNAHFFVVGEDLIFKEYEHFPTDKFDKLDWKRAPVKPSVENADDQHPLGFNCYHMNEARHLFVSGGRDGSVIVRQMQEQHKNYLVIAHFNSQAVACGGVTHLTVDKAGDFVYTCGNDGSIFCHSINGKPYGKAVNTDFDQATLVAMKAMPVQEPRPIV